MKKLLIGTNNPSKLRVFREYLEGIDVCCVSPAELGLVDIPDEGARDAVSNAVEKAKAWHRMSGLPVVTEDSGLVFLDLPADHPDQPGVLVRRAAGHTMNDEEMLEWYRSIVHKHGGSLRAAWEDAWCVLQDEDCYSIYASTPEILDCFAILLIDKPCATRLPGWPLDSLTYYPALKKYKAEMTIDEMDAVKDDRGEAARIHRQNLLDWYRNAVNMLK
ncbi:MAG: hypothetical protein E7316_00425 [Clostridiales bacterium]|nr:hypothetical protein [Clostridiales bacterium]